MKQFDYRKFLAENKATFHSSLNEGDLTRNIGLGLDYEATEEMIRDYAEHLREESPYDVEELAQLYLDEPRSFPSQLDYSFFRNNYDDILSVAMTGLNEGEAAYEYEKGKKAGEKMKKSDLKAKIKEMILAEQGKKVDFLNEVEDMLDEESEFYMEKSTRIASFIRDLNRLVDEYHAELYLNDGLFDAISRLIKVAKEEAMNLNEAEGDEEVDAETTDEVTPDEEVEVTTDVEVDEVDPDVKAVQDALTQAQAVAQKLGDKKLTDQIGNTITFFTRAHVVKTPTGTVTENKRK
jgi:hypothetical protein